MSTNDLAHLEAMGLPAPAYVAPSLRQDIRNRSDEMQIHQLANLVTPLVYATRRSHVPEEELASFEACRSNVYKPVQTFQNDLADEMRSQVPLNCLGCARRPEVAGTAPGLCGYTMGKSGGSGSARECGMAEEGAIYAVEQAEKHCWLLRKFKWGYRSTAVPMPAT
ncbi:hypothetical protein FPOA_03821 [Fusarium poae]|uniref:Uncharacterized protein n=1 Tax=Fusarium poae TaxID=36050 RepID=A0A1B8ART9_FUSPO|nr:hypothetical protein FPOA_03821 [Fusarium poae]